MTISLIHNADTSMLDLMLLDQDGFCKVLPADDIKAIDRNAFRLWCVRNAVYLYPTKELVDHILQLIDGRVAIEVGSGNGHLGNALGIQMTDSGMQTWPDIMSQYAAMGQACTNPPACVDIIDAENAIQKYQPKVVVASWLTHKWQAGMSTGNMFGPDESLIIDNTEAYIHIGNDTVHFEKPCWSKPHSKAYHDWIVSRASNPQLDHIAVWGR